ncbi:MAG: indole-3-glycerol phosphate synthase TrpC [Alphaproteobacteria bacterium]
MSDALARICADKVREIARRKAARPLAEIEAAARDAPTVRGFADALVSGGGPALIAEIKKASPSAGLIRADFDPAALALAYAAGGARCLSVLTDAPYFQGRGEDLVAARGAVALPVLRKDFMLDPWQVPESRALGADCILIIMAALDDGMARELAQAAGEWGMDALVEVHDEGELERAAALPCRLIGVNNRDLKTLKTDLAVSERLAPLVPRDRTMVAESGIAGPGDIARLADAGARAFLVGGALMAKDDVEAATRALLSGAPTSAPASTPSGADA